MNKKKVLTAAMATGLVAAQLAMPAMAKETGSMNVTVGVKEGLIRVEVPTMIEVSIDQFEQGGKSQIYSEEFTMLNKSPMPIRVDVKSTVTQGSGTPATLVATKKAAEDSTAANGAMWMAMAAATSKTGNDYGYDDVTTSEDEEEIADLDDNNANVSTFVTVGSNKEATQTFYLQKGSDTLQWKFVEDSTELTVNPGYAYEVTTGTDKNSAYSGTSNATAFNNALVSHAVVELNTAGDAIVKVWEKGDSVDTASGATFGAGNKVYDVAATATAINLTTAKAYLYQESTSTATEGGEAAFSYIGKLSGADKEWATGGSGDLNTVGINYTFAGAGETVYAEAAEDCTYGFYLAPTGPAFASTTVVAKKGQAAVFTVDMGNGSKGASDIESVTVGDLEFLSGGFATFEDDKLTITADAIDALFEGGFLSATSSQTTVELTVTFTMNNSDVDAAEATLILKGK